MKLTLSTIWQQPAATRLVWIALLDLANADGEIDATLVAVAHCASVSREDAQAAIAWLSSPDEHDNSCVSEDGRKIEATERGWRILSKLEPPRDIAIDDRPWSTYFVEALGTDPRLIKIGRSRDVRLRLAALEQGSPVQLLSRLVIAGDREAEFHDRFADARIRREWFRLTPEIEEFIRRGGA